MLQGDQMSPFLKVAFDKGVGNISSVTQMKVKLTAEIRAFEQGYLTAEESCREEPDLV